MNYQYDLYDSYPGSFLTDFLWRFQVTGNTQPPVATPQTNAAGMRGDVQGKWDKFGAEEVTALKDKDDLVGKVRSKYSLDESQAQRDVDAFAKGRQL
jgi:hypothetical protein